MKKGNIVRTLYETEKREDNQKVHEQFMKLKSMECPCCGDAMQLKAGVWRCKRCAYCITQKSMLDGAIFWFCDECGKFMNVQPDFTTSAGTWKCLSCGFMNDVSENNIDDFEEDTTINEKNKVVVPAKIIENIEGVIQKTGDTFAAGKAAALNAGASAKDALAKQLDINHDGKIDIEDIIILGLKTPGVKVERSKFLENELRIHYDAETVRKAIDTTPLYANIPMEDINALADAVIQRERYFVSGIAAALGAPGGTAMAATIPADIIQYYGYTLRVAQELMYLYGFPEIVTADNEAQIDTPTMNTLIVAMGVMFGVAGANNAMKAMAKALGVGVEKQLMKKALTKGVIYPIVKNVAKWFGVKMTREVFAGFFKKAIPVAGGVLGGSITYLSFKPCCERLKSSLMDTKLSNPLHVESREEIEIFNAIVTDANEVM
mgnify:FL=1